MHQNAATLLGFGAIVATIAVGTCSTNARFDDLNARFDDLNGRFDDVNTRFDDVNARIDRIEVRIDRVDARLVAIDDRLRAVEVGFGKVDQRLLTLERVILPAPEDD